MTNEARELMRNSILPVFLGDNCRSRRLSALLFYRFGLVSTICDKRKSPWSVLSIDHRFSKLCKSRETEILAEELLHLADKHRERTLVLIPASEEYSCAVKELAPILETEFIISSQADILGCPPIADMAI